MTDHQTETYKSMIALSVEAMKYCALANGGAAVALLAYLGNVHAKSPLPPAQDLSTAMAWFLAGLAFAGVLVGAAYITQLALYNESFKDPIPRKTGRHNYALRTAIASFVLSLGSFAMGAWSAVTAWAEPATSRTAARLPEHSPTPLASPAAVPVVPVAPSLDSKAASTP